jgi:hypothetical protein
VALRVSKKTPASPALFRKNDEASRRQAFLTLSIALATKSSADTTLLNDMED